MDRGDEEEARAIAGYIPDPERPSRIARKRAETARAARLAATVQDSETSQEPPPRPPGEAAPPSSAIPTVLRIRELEEAIARLSEDIRAIAHDLSAGRPGRFPRAAGLLAALVASLALAGLAALAELRFSALEEDVRSSLEQKDGLAAELARELEETRADRERAALEAKPAPDMEAAARIDAIEKERAAQWEAANARNARLEATVTELERQLAAAVIREAELKTTVERFERQALDRMVDAQEVPRRTELPKDEARADAREAAGGKPPAPAEKEEERTAVERLNTLLAAQDGARLYRIAGAGPCRGGWLEDPVLKVYGQEGELLEEIRAARLSVELSRKDSMAALDLYDCERRFKRETRDEIVTLPNHHVEFFDTDTEVWARETPELAKWRE
ncbi:MAG: hypothetical protein HY720_12020 [Planctomycetes bacterium]|nr:hypothetical protein [Planctomycetota bacterium]